MAGRAAPATITFDPVTPIALPTGSSQAVDQGFTLLATGAGTAQTILDTGVGGDLASAVCLTFCSTNGTIAAFNFASGGFTLTRTGGGIFSATAIDAAIGTNLGRATRFTVEGMAGITQVALQSFLLLPLGFDFGLDTPPSDTTPGVAETFQTLNLTGFSDIDALHFTYVGELTGSDPESLLSNGFFPEFAIDNVAVDVAAQMDVPEPVSMALLVTGLVGLSLARRRARG